MPKTPEGIIVAYARKRLTEKGCLCRKIGYEGRRGCPDMLVLVPEIPSRPAKVKFIEFKKDENAQPDPHQLREHERMRAVGADVRVIGTRQQVDELVQELFPS